MRFAVLALDRPGSLEIRLATREAHLEYLSQFDTPVAGPLLDDEGNPCGSMLFYEAPSRQAVDEIVAADPYNRAGLFESITIREFKTVAWPA